MNCYFIICDDARDRILALCLRKHYYVFLRFNPAKELLTQRSLAGFYSGAFSHIWRKSVLCNEGQKGGINEGITTF